MRRKAKVRESVFINNSCLERDMDHDKATKLIINPQHFVEIKISLKYKPPFTVVNRCKSIPSHKNMISGLLKIITTPLS